MLKVFQIVLTDSQIDEVNNNQDAMPAFYSRYLKTTFSPKADDVNTAVEAGDYQHVADVSVDDLETGFAVMNRWNEVDEKLVRRLAPLHSMSVGDIVEKADGTRHVVAAFGFEQI